MPQTQTDDAIHGWVLLTMKTMPLIWENRIQFHEALDRLLAGAEKSGLESCDLDTIGDALRHLPEFTRQTWVTTTIDLMRRGVDGPRPTITYLKESLGEISTSLEANA